MAKCAICQQSETFKALCYFSGDERLHKSRNCFLKNNLSALERCPRYEVGTDGALKRCYTYFVGWVVFRPPDSEAKIVVVSVPNSVVGSFRPSHSLKPVFLGP